MRKGGQAGSYRKFRKINRSTHIKNRMSFIITIVVFLLSSFLFIDSFLKIEKNFLPELSGSIVGVEKLKTEQVNLVFSNTQDYIWVPSEKVSISSLKVSGEFEDKGLVKIYLEKEEEKYLVFDSSKRSPQQGEFSEEQ